MRFAVLIMVLAAAPAFAGASADEALRAELQRRYPQVQRWDIRPFDDAEHENTSVQVVSIGARSAVRVGRRLQWFAVSGFQSVVSATRAIATGAALDGSAGQIAERDVIAARCDPVTDRNALTGMRTRRPLRANEVICSQAIEPRPTVARGETVTVRYVGARVTLVTKGVASSDGNVGDSLIVSHVKSNDAFAAQVSGAGEVTIHE
jgi:flagella basal body P-ring formation protein FlgA